MSKHTPGPWYDDGYRIHAPTESGDKRDGRVIVEYKHVDDFNEADARLIAAAPDLLEACKKANTCASIPDYIQAIIRAAIAKATKATSD